MLLDLEPIELDRQVEYNSHFAACSEKASDYSFVNLRGWAEEYGLFWAWTDELVWIKQTRPHVAYWAPVGAWESIDWHECFRKYLSNEELFVRVPENLLKCWKRDMEKRLAVEESRGHWDYLYSSRNSLSLKATVITRKGIFSASLKENMTTGSLLSAKR